jgi:hypothetical protein
VSALAEVLAQPSPPQEVVDALDRVEAIKDELRRRAAARRAPVAATVTELASAVEALCSRMRRLEAECGSDGGQHADL